MSLTALLLLGVQGIADQNITSNSTSPLTPPCPTIPTVLQTPCPIIIRNITTSVLFWLKLKWNEESPCEGRLYVHSHEPPKALCFNSNISVSWWKEVCKDRRCGDFKVFKSTSSRVDGIKLTSNMSFIYTKCMGSHIMCQDPPGTELAAYKAATGIFIFLILGVIMVQFSRPTYKAIRKRFSQKRQSRWVGPTQSVCYHRGQGPPNKNTDKRQSFPGLERLTVNQSREPSSNRNSDYDSYS
ncbi:hypothetical protein G5714_000597 [Onychostoma macrolepis]|uniref:T-cell surface glycoprotein CD5 n=2 Tax=Onychostoma macrolepis TaxID=369639 RepID=A0A7J6DGS3_9TELE|nr:hypothetical protein G5714_000597 [Onychostoma macrolepis]